MSEMVFRPLGSSGLNVSVVGLGCNNLGFRLEEDEVAPVVAAALDAGINLFDTAASYGESEQRLGKALAGRRNEVVVATKFPSPHEPTKHQPGSRHHIIEACEGSLRRLGTDHIDLYQMHRPDPATPIDETLEALDGLVRSGKVRYVGNSNFAGWQIADADWTARTNGWVRMISAQNHYSLVSRDVEREVIPACEQYGLGMLPYFPLESGVLTGKYRRDQPPPEGARLSGSDGMSRMSGMFLHERNFTMVEALEKVAAGAGVTLLHLAMGGLAAKPAVASVIAGATSAEQVRANAEAGVWEPAPDVMEQIEAATA